MDNNSTDNLGRTPTLGVVAISFNEQEDLRGFIDHLIPWVDEIVIIDDGSNDHTEDIAVAYGDKIRFIISPREVGEYFSHQRNKGIEASTSDWLLHMDVDERVPPSLSEEILVSIQRQDREGYRFRRLNYFMHRPMRGGGWQGWNLVHLARRESLRFEGMYHEKCALQAPDDRIGQLKCKMYHLNESDFKKRLIKSHTYLEETTEQINARSKRVGYLDIFLRPPLEFFKKYIIKQGVRDGVPGLISAIHSSSAVFRSYALVWDQQNSIPRERLEASVSEEWRQHRADSSAVAKRPS